MLISVQVHLRSSALNPDRIISGNLKQKRECVLKSPVKIYIALTLLILLALAGCGSTETSNHESQAAISFESMPPEIRTAPASVREAYQYAVANPDVFKQIPCYCGCGAMGHTSNYACYISNVDDKGNVVYDTHALGCSICVDITQDTMRLLQDGKAVQDIKAYIDQTYSQYGPSNLP